ncbi:MAG: ABC transporter substrate-binding protein [Bacteroidota bacterium]
MKRIDKNFRMLVCLAVAALFLSVWGIPFTQAAAKAPIKIGVVYSSSGSQAHTGLQEANVINMIVDEVNAKGGINGHPLKAILENDDTQTVKSVSAAKKLVFSDKVHVLMGANTSSAIKAIQQQVTEMEKVPYISMVGSDPALTTMGQQWYFRNSLSAAYQTGSIIDYVVKDLKLKSFAMIFDAASASDQAKAVEAGLNKAGFNLVAKEQFKTGDTSFNSQLLKIKQANPDALVTIGVAPEAAGVAKQVRDMGINARIIGLVAIVYDEYINLGGSAVEGTVAASSFRSDNPAANVQAFVKKYQEKFKDSPDHAAAQTFDAMNMLIKALTGTKLKLTDKALQSDRQLVRDAITKINNYDGVVGLLSYGPQDRDAYEKTLIVEVKNGKWTVVKDAR